LGSVCSMVPANLLTYKPPSRTLGEGEKLYEVVIGLRSTTEQPDVMAILTQQLPWLRESRDTVR
jgi:hypothetical protein